MTAPVVVRLDAAISSAPDEVSRARLLAEKACYLVRMGDVTQAEEIRLSLRATYSDGRDLNTSVQIMVLEGLMSFFQSLGGNARDKMTRAQLLSVAANNKKLIALTSSWLAHMQFIEDKFPAAIGSVEQAISAIQIGQWGVLGRIGLLLTDLFTICGDPQASKRWYAVARNAAVNYGDHASIGALTYNSAAFKIFNLRLEDAKENSVEQTMIASVDSEARTAVNYHIASGAVGLEYMLTGLTIGVHLLRHKFEDALALLGPLLDSRQMPESYGYGIVLLSDALLCSVRLNQFSQAEGYLESLNAVDVEKLSVSDRIMIYSNLAEIKNLGMSQFQTWHSIDGLPGLIQQYEKECADCLRQLAELTTIPPQLSW